MKTMFPDFSEPWKWVPDLLELFKESNVNYPVQGNSSLLIKEEGVNESRVIKRCMETHGEFPYPPPWSMCLLEPMV